MKTSFIRINFISTRILIPIICLSILLSSLTISQIRAQPVTDKKVILMIWDGTQRNHLLELYSTNQLPNLKAMVDGGGLLRTDLVVNTETCLEGSGDGYDLETGPGNSAIITGYGYPTTQNQDNYYPNPIPAGLTFFERVKQAYPEIKTGMITSKSQNFWPLPALQNAQSSLDFWWSEKAQSSLVTTQAMTFITQNANSPFFLYVHFRVPDEAGHAYGENSAQYTNKLIENDAQLGLILAQLSYLGITGGTTVLVTTDHGYGENASDHEECIDDNRNIWIATNNPTLINNFSVPAYQTGITPSLFDLFEMDKNTVEPSFPSESLYLIPEPPPTLTATLTATPDGSATPLPPPTPTNTPEPTLPPLSKFIFITSTTFSGNLGGVYGADQKCQTIASQAGLPGIYKAWLSDGTTDISSRILHADVIYQRIDSMTVANNWNDLTDGNLNAPIIITESGGMVSSYGVWTNTNANGQAVSTTNTCTDWSATVGQSVRGYSNTTSRSWTNNGLLGCNYFQHLYCIQE